MFRTCIYCGGDLQQNASLEWFPVGSFLAFDPHKGRLWAVCPRCSRWTLAPIEERWEAVEEAEVLFRACSSRSHFEEVGFAQLPDGTRLLRIGRALPFETATWRYGAALRKRRIPAMTERAADFSARSAVPVSAILLSVFGATLSIPASLGLLAGTGLAIAIPRRWFWRRRARHVLLRLNAGLELASDRRVLRLADAIGARLILDPAGDPAVRLETTALDEIRRSVRWSVGVDLLREPITVAGEDARRMLGRLMVFVNRGGATRSQVESALAMLSLAGGAEPFILQMAAREPGVGGRRRPRPRSAPPLIPPLEGVALELALHEQTERRALNGDLRALKAAWREAEEIATIADAL